MSNPSFTPLDPERTLHTLLQQPRLSPDEAYQGIVACFTLTSQHFLALRMPEADEQQRRAAAADLIDQVGRELGVAFRRQPGVAELRRVCRVLEEQLGFGAEPTLLERHRQVIGELLAKVSE